jgi:hypothetical protein
MRKAEFLSLSQIRLVLISDARNAQFLFHIFLLVQSILHAVSFLWILFASPLLMFSFFQ